MARTEAELPPGMCCGSESCRDRLCPGHPVQRAEHARLDRMLLEDRTEARISEGTVFALIVAACVFAVAVVSFWAA